MRDLLRKRALLAAIVGPALVLVLAAWLRRWTTDDAFINYRIVRQLEAGNGPVFNAGERVEAATSTLWLYLLWLGDVVLPFRIEYVAIALSIPLAAAGMVCMSLASSRLLDPPGEDVRPTWLPAGTLVLLALVPMWDWATAGLETGLALGWTGLLALGLAHAVDRPERPPWWVLVVAGTGPLVRPDCAVPAAFVLAFLLWRCFRASGWKVALPRLGAAIAIPVAYQLFRMAYYAALVPNTALAKQAGFAHWEEGWAYLVDFAGTYHLFVPVVGLLMLGVAAAAPLPRPRQVAVALLPAAGLVHALVIMRAGGDYAHARLLLAPLFSVVAPVAVVPVAFRRGERSPHLTGAAIGAVGLLAIWGIVAAGFLRKGEATVTNRTLVADGRAAIVGGTGIDNPVTAESQGWGTQSAPAKRVRNAVITVGSRELDVDPKPGLHTPLLAMHGVGVSGYSVGTDVYVLDQLGLGDVLTSHFRLDRAGFVGHEKPLPDAWLAALLTNDDLDQSDLGGAGLFVTPLYVSPEGELDEDVDAARAALRCAAIRRLRDATSKPLTFGRALDNLWHAASYTRERIDPDPKRARC